MIIDGRINELKEMGSLPLHSEKYGRGMGWLTVRGRVWPTRSSLDRSWKIMLPAEIAVIRVKGHQKGNLVIALGNLLAGERAREVRSHTLQPEVTANHFTLEIPSPPERRTFSEKEALKGLGAKESEGRWIVSGGREMLNKQVMREIVAILHPGSHRGVWMMCRAVL